MRFESIRAKGVGPFREEISVDLGSISGRLVAVCGGNGQGKSTLLELLAGALYRTCPTRGALSSLATSRDAFVEVDVVNGARHRLRHVLDSVSGKGESVVTDEGGRPLVASAKLREFDAWAAKHLPSPEVLYASTFAAQGSGGFLELKAGERKAVLLRVLGIERLEALADRAREHVRSAKASLATLDARVADERERASDPIKVATEIDDLKAKRAAAEQALAAAREAYEEARLAEETARAALKAIAEAHRRRAEMFTRIEAAKRRRTDIEQRLKNNQGVIESADEIREAVQKAKDIDGEIASLAAELAAARAELTAAERELSAAQDQHQTLESRDVALDARAERIRRTLSDKEIVAAAQASLDALRLEVEDFEYRIDQAEIEIENGQELALNGAAQRVERLRSGLQAVAAEQIPDSAHCGPATPSAFAREVLSDDDEKAAAAHEAPQRIDLARERLAEHRVTLAGARLKLAAAEKTAARADEIAKAAAEIVEVEAERAQVVEAQAACGARCAEIEQRVGDLQRLVGRLQETHTARVSVRAELEASVKLADRLAQAEARIAELEPQLAAANVDLANLTVEHDGIAIEKEPAMPDVFASKQLVDARDTDLRGIEAGLAVKEAQMASAREAEKRLAKLKTERRAGEEDLSDWTRLAEDLGRDGLQAAEVDCAVPELSEITNHLLHEAFGPRFTVTFETKRASSDGKKEIEALDVRVLDSERGRDAQAETLSGGERVIVSEAISLALTTIATRASGLTEVTLIRDESGAALDPANGRAYVAMLRRAMTLIGARQCLFVSHNAELADLADARIEIRDGKVRVAS